MSRDALIIGINQYKYLKRLDSPATDAEAIAQILEHQGGFTINRLPASEDIDAENRSIVTVADSGEITLPELKNALVQLFNPTSQKPPEVALFYFSGHGLREDQGGIQQGFLATTHSETKSYNNCLPLDWLRKLLRNSPVRQQIVWLDCCYSGELFNFAEADPGQRDQGFNRCFIAASRDFEAAIAPRTSKHSLFTKALLKALNYSQSAHGYIDNYQLEENLKQILKSSSFPQQLVYGNSGERPIVLTGWMYATKPAFGEDFCPYKGLHYFDNKPEDAQFFKGRDKLIAELLTKVETKPFLAVLGASGNGKSSVVRAGVLYQLQRTERWQIVNPFTPTANPLTALTNGLGTTDVLTLVTSANARLILTIDQFEEVFSLCQDGQARETFFNILLDAVEQAAGKLCLLVVMRADFMDKCSQYPRLARYFQDHQHIVTRPTEAEIQQIIESPAKQAGLSVEPRLVAEMITDFKDSLGGLPLLEFALTTLWEKGKADRLLRYADYQALGRIQGILEKKATETYEELTPAEQVVAKRIFLELTELGEGKPDTRRQVPQTDLLGLTTTQTSVESVIAKLVKEYLIVTDKTNKTKVTVVNIAHDALIEHWSLLKKWLDQSREDLKLQRQINEGAKAWKEKKKALLVGVDLARAEEYLGTHLEKVPLSKVGVEFVKASVAKERWQSRLKQALVSLVFIAAIVAVWFAYRANENEKVAMEQKVVAQQQRDKALSGQSRFLANLATQQLEKGNSATAMRLVLEALPGTSLDNPERPSVVEAQHQLYAAIERHWRGVWEHDGHVSHVEFSPDGKMVLTASGNNGEPFGNHAYLWEFPSGKLLQVFRGHTQAVISVSFSPDAKRVLTASFDGTARLWDIKSGQQLNVLRNKHLAIQFKPDRVFLTILASFSPDGKRIVMVSSEQERRDDDSNLVWEGDDLKRDNRYGVYLWDAETGQELAPIWGKHTAVIYRARFSPDSKRLVTASQDDTARIWDVESGRELVVLQHEGKGRWLSGPKNTTGVSYAIFSPDGKQVLTGARDSTARLWDAKTGQQLLVLRGHTQTVWFAAFSPDGKKIATASFDKTARLWDASSGKELAVLAGHKGTVFHVAFSPDGQRLITTSMNDTPGSAPHSEGNARLWNADGQLLAELRGHQEGVNSAAFSPDGKWLITASNDKTTRIWNAFTGQQPSIISGIEVNTVQTSRDGSRIFTIQGTLGYLWTNDGQQLAICKGNNGVFSKDGQKLLVYTRSDGSKQFDRDYDQSIYLYDTKNGQELAKLPGHKPAFEGNDALVLNAQFSSSGRLIATTSNSDRTTRIWNATTGQEMATLLHTFALLHSECLMPTTVYLRGDHCVAFSPDEKLIAIADGDGTASVWNISNSRKIASLEEPSQNTVINVTFSPDSMKVATALTNTVRLWDVNTGKELTTFIGHEYSVEAIAFSPNGAQVLTGSRDNTARLWNAETGKEIAVLSGHDGFVHEVSFSEDGKKIFTVDRAGVNFGTINQRRVFDAKTFKLLTLSPSLLLEQYEGEMQAVLHSYGKDFTDRSTPGTLDETTLIASDGVMPITTFSSDKTLYWLPIFPDLNTLISYTQNFLSRREWTCEERRQFYLETTQCPEQKLSKVMSVLAINYLQFAEAGDAEMQYFLATDYIERSRFAKNIEEGIKWLRKAAEQGHAAAQALLASHYYRGVGVPQDYKKSSEWAFKAAEQGQTKAQALLCGMYYNGIGVVQDDKEAFKWCSKAAVEYKNASVQMVLAFLYKKGRGVKQDLQEAVKWYSRAEREGYTEGVLKRIVVTSISPNSQAEQLGLQVGDLITHYDSHPLFGTDSFISEHDAEPMMNLPKELKVLRGSQGLVFQIPPGKLGIELKDVDK